MEELGEILRGKIVDGLESEKQDLVNDANSLNSDYDLIIIRRYILPGESYLTMQNPSRGH